jgi:hypothetical protein
MKAAQAYDTDIKRHITLPFDWVRGDLSDYFLSWTRWFTCPGLGGGVDVQLLAHYYSVLKERYGADHLDKAFDREGDEYRRGHPYCFVFLGPDYLLPDDTDARMMVLAVYHDAIEGIPLTVPEKTWRIYKEFRLELERFCAECLRQFPEMVRSWIEQPDKPPQLGPVSDPADRAPGNRDQDGRNEQISGPAPSAQLASKSVPERFTFRSGYVEFDGKTLNYEDEGEIKSLPTGRTQTVLKILVESFGQPVAYRDLNEDGTEGEASGQLRNELTILRKALSRHAMPCKIVVARGESVKLVEADPRSNRGRSKPSRIQPYGGRRHQRPATKPAGWPRV